MKVRSNENKKRRINEYFEVIPPTDSEVFFRSSQFRSTKIVTTSPISINMGVKFAYCPCLDLTNDGPALIVFVLNEDCNSYDNVRIKSVSGLKQAEKIVEKMEGYSPIEIMEKITKWKSIG